MRATALLDNALANRKSNTGAGKLAAMQPFEDAEDILVMARIDANAIVANRKLNRAAVIGGRDMDLERLRSPEGDRVGDHLAKELIKLREIKGHGRQRIAGDLGAAGANFRFECQKSAL